ncbi:MAG TPA: SfnB family sulfur acquisition oxidoreductase [Dongiaceae bacterium]|nr:SfnB family sulfur acquisition oxidoreductase [Dongiaceae bacterium]
MSNTPAQPAPKQASVEGAARPKKAAHVIASDVEAIEVAVRLAETFAGGAGDRDRHRRLPVEELDVFSASGLWGITVPKAYGGADVSHATLGKVVATIAAADSSLSQIPQNHFEILEVIRGAAGEEQKRQLYALVLQGYRLGNAFSEFQGKNVESFETRLTRSGDAYRLNGRKFYSTGALFAHLVPVVAIDDDGRIAVAIVDRDAPGLQVVDDWSAFGQRTTASGTVLLQDVLVPASRVLPAYLVYDRPSPIGAQSQLLHAAIDAGIARGAIDRTIDFVRNKARPWIDSGKDRASDDPYTIAAIGDLKIKLHAAEALLERSGRQLDATVAAVTEASIAAAKIAVAEAKVLSTEVALLAANKLFELAGTRSTLAEHNLDRFWRDARTHTLHDPVRWKFAAVGNYYLNGVNPPLHSWI